MARDELIEKGKTALEKAMEHPGVKEVEEVYQKYLGSARNPEHEGSATLTGQAALREAVIIYERATRMAMSRNQVTGEKHDYFITLAQLEVIIQRTEAQSVPLISSRESSKAVSVGAERNPLNGSKRKL